MTDLCENEIYAKKIALIEVGRRCFETGLQNNSGGNLSVRLACAPAIIIKPSGVGFNECSVDNLMVSDLDGRTLRGAGKPSKDLDFHVELYRIRSDVEAIVHVHSPWATGWACAGMQLDCITVQARQKLGLLPLIPLSENGGPQGATEVGAVMANPAINAALMENHGTIGVGKDLRQAVYVVELIEETAHIAFVKSALNSFGCCAD